MVDSANKADKIASFFWRFDAALHSKIWFAALVHMNSKQYDQYKHGTHTRYSGRITKCTNIVGIQPGQTLTTVGRSVVGVPENALLGRPKSAFYLLIDRYDFLKSQSTYPGIT